MIRLGRTVEVGEGERDGCDASGCLWSGRGRANSGRRKRERENSEAKGGRGVDADGKSLWDGSE